MSQIIFHVDVNSAFLSWEAVYQLRHIDSATDLREIPSAIGGDQKKRHGIILAKSTPAKAFNIKTGESINEALKKCPHLVLVSPRFELYKKMSHSFMKILKEYTPNVEQYSIDEAYMDMSGTESLFGPPVELAHLIKERIYNELGFTVNIGISTNKLLAKMAGELKKPNLVHTLFPSEISKKMWPLPASELFFVGRSTSKKLGLLGIKTIGDLAQADLTILKSHFNKHGEIIWNYANGVDVSPIESNEHESKGYGNSTTISFDVTEESTAKIILLSLCETVASRLRKDNKKAEVVSVSIKDSSFRYSSHQITLFSATNITQELHLSVCDLFDQLWDGLPIRLLGVSTSHIVDEASSRQLSLFENQDYEKLEKVDAAIDKIREKYGMDSIKRASFLQGKVKHMGGGISTDK